MADCNSSSNTNLGSSKGLLLLQMGNTDAAKTIFESVLNEFPDNLNAQFGQSIASFYNGDKDEVFITIDKLIQSMPEEHMLYRAKGYFLIQADRQSEALPIFKKAHELATNPVLKKQYEFYISFVSDDHISALVIYNELLSLNAASVDIQMIVTACMMNVQDFASLKSSFDDLISLAPHVKNIPMLRGIAKCYRGDYQGAKEDILSSFDSIKDRLPMEILADMHFIIGYCDSQLKDYPQAICRFSQVISIDQLRGEAYYERGISKLMNEDPENAIPDFIKSLTLNYYNEECYANLGNAYLQLYKIDLAIEHYKKLLTLSRMNPSGHFGLGRCNLLKMDNNAARREFDVCIQIDDTYASAWAHLGLLDSLEGDMDQALINARKAEEFGDNSGLIEVVKGWIAYNAKQYSESKKWCDIAIKKNSRIGFAYWCRGLSKMNLIDENAIDDIRTSNALNGGNPAQGIGGALAAFLEKRFEDAEKMFTQAIELNIEQSKKHNGIGLQIELMEHVLFYFRAQARIEQKKYRTALKDVIVVLDQEPTLIEALHLKAAILINLLKYQDAISVVKSIIELNPQFAPAYLLLGKIDYADPKNNRDRALGHFEHAIEIDERLGEAFYYIGKIHAENNAIEDALVALEKAEEFGFIDATREIELIRETKALYEKPVEEVAATDTELSAKITDQAVKFAFKEWMDNPKTGRRTAAGLAVDKFFPNLKLNTRARKIDSIRNTIKQMVPRRRRSK
jgi:tetratricopeptide (TPR) repeat protein